MVAEAEVGRIHAVAAGMVEAADGTAVDVAETRTVTTTASARPQWQISVMRPPTGSDKSQGWMVRTPDYLLPLPTIYMLTLWYFIIIFL